jgi:hypothetical protein
MTEHIVNYDVPVLAPNGSVLVLPERWATLLAENLRTGPLLGPGQSQGTDTARSAADKIELRLIGEETSPVDFDEDERIEILETLTAVCTGWHKSEGGEWTDSAALAFYRAFEGRGTT